MFKTISLKIASLAFVAGLAGAANAADANRYPDADDQLRGGVKAGILECDIDGGIGYIVGSAKELACVFKPNHGRPEHYVGNIKKLGVDIGVTQQSKLLWMVFAPVAGYRAGALSGLYLGVNAEATVGGGVGANILVGGTGASISLQPLSFTGQIGVNVAAAGAALTLAPVAR